MRNDMRRPGPEEGQDNPQQGQGHWHDQIHRDLHGFLRGPGRELRGGHFGGRRGGWGGIGGLGGPGGRERLERGVLRYVILDVLRDGPRHGYEIIKQLEERTAGQYSPSPGTLYPTLQYLDDLGLIQAVQDEGRRVYQLTDAGSAELKEHLGLAEVFWARFRGHTHRGAILHEINFLKDALNDLTRTVAGSIHSAVFRHDADTIRQVRQVLERSQNDIREIITQGVSAQSLADDHEDPSDSNSPNESDNEPEVTRS